MNNKDTNFKQAIVLGGSISGLLAARVLSNHFDRVTILERDPVADRPEPRKGQPQARHIHGLLGSGLQVMSRYFPDFPQALANNGAIIADFAESMRWYAYGGYRKQFKMGIPATLMSRPLLEFLVRERVLALPNVTLVDNCRVLGLAAGASGQQITGVQVDYRDGRQANEILIADLVVDCTGRGSRSPRWLQELGYGPVPESEVKVNVGYATRLYKRNPADPRGQNWFHCTPEAPHETRFGVLFPIEGDRWIYSQGGGSATILLVMRPLLWTLLAVCLCLNCTASSARPSQFPI